MYLHVGNDVIVNYRDIIGIFDLENTSISKFTKEFLRSRQQEVEVVTVAADLPKSFVVCENGGKQTVYLSQLSAATLKRRYDGKMMGAR